MYRIVFPRKKKLRQIKRIIIQKSRIEKDGYSDIIDYQMSEKFGLDWRKYDNKRIMSFMSIMANKNEAQDRELNKSYGRPKT